MSSFKMSAAKILPVLAALALLVSCAPTFTPQLEGSRVPMVTDEAIVARDGTRLPLRRWEATGQYAGKPRAVIVGLHGMSDYSNAFAMPGAVWARAGITTLAYDQRGFGKSEQPGIWAGADAMRSDLNDAVAAARARYPGVPVFALGESMGGAVVLTALASANPPAADGIVLVAPAVWSRADMPLTYRVALFLGAHLVPGMILSNNAAGRVVKIVASDNNEMLRALGRDPLFQKQTRTGTLYGLVNLMDEARTAPEKMKEGHITPPPILFVYGANDQIIPAKPTEAVIAGLASAAEVKRYDHGYHMLLRDLEGESVDHDIAGWIEKQGRNS
jgi:acylglycerol lipase